MAGRTSAAGPWTDATTATAMRLRDEGKTGREIADMLGYAPSTVSEKLRAARPAGEVAPNARAASVRVDWEPPRPPVCTFNAASRAYCAALDRLRKAPTTKRAEAAKAVAAALQVMMNEWRKFALTQDGPVPEVA